MRMATGRSHRLGASPDPHTAAGGVALDDVKLGAYGTS